MPKLRPLILARAALMLWCSSFVIAQAESGVTFTLTLKSASLRAAPNRPGPIATRQPLLKKLTRTRTPRLLVLY